MRSRNLSAGRQALFGLGGLARFSGPRGSKRGTRKGRPVALDPFKALGFELTLGRHKPAELPPESGRSNVPEPADNPFPAAPGPGLDPAIVAVAPVTDQSTSPEPDTAAGDGFSFDESLTEPVSERPVTEPLVTEQPIGEPLVSEPPSSGTDRSPEDGSSPADGSAADVSTSESSSADGSPAAARPGEIATPEEISKPEQTAKPEETATPQERPAEGPAVPVEQLPAVDTPVAELPIVDEPVDLDPDPDPDPANAATDQPDPAPQAPAQPELENPELENSPTQASPTENSVVAQWNELALQAIREDKPVPTVITRSLHLAHAAMYDAWAVFNTEAAGAYFNPRPLHRRARGRITEQAMERAVSRAAHHTLSQLFPAHTDRFDALLDQLGYQGRPDPAARLGLRAARTVLRRRANDGSNARNDYSDNSGYAPMNGPDDSDLDPNYWTPLKVPNGSAVDENGIPIVTDDPSSYDVQTPLTPHWGDVDPFAIRRGDDFRPVAPPKLNDFSTYTDAHGVVSSNDAAYRRQFTEVAQLSAALTPEQKVIAEYWADGPNSSTPPGHWNEFAQDIALREEHGLEQDVKLFFALNNALMDTGIAIWDAKYAHDYVRPQTAIRYLFADEQIAAWGGPNQGTQMIPGSSWQPYQDVTFVTPAFPEYTSGHSGFSYAAASVLEAFTGTDRLYDGVSRGAQDLDRDGQPDLIGSYSTDALAFEQYDGDPIKLQWDTVWDAAAEAGRSRLYGGIHIQDGDLRAREMGKAVAEVAWEASEALFSAGWQGRRPRRRGRPKRSGRKQRLLPVIEGVASASEMALATATDGLSAVFDGLSAASDALNDAFEQQSTLHSMVQSTLNPDLY